MKIVGLCVKQYLEGDVYIATLQEPFLLLGPLRALEITDIVTDYLAAFSIDEQLAPRFRRLLYTSLGASTLLTLVGYAWSCYLKSKRSFYGEVWHLAIGLVLLGFEDGIMVPINLLFLVERTGLSQNETINLEEVEFESDFIVDISTVGVSVLVGIFTTFVRLWTLLRFFRCASPRYTGSVKLLEKFLKWERTAQPYKRFQEPNLLRDFRRPECTAIPCCLAYIMSNIEEDRYEDGSV